MGKRSRSKGTATVEQTSPGSRQPCPCGSGLRYRNCHGGKGPAPTHVARPFAGLVGECDLVALREFVPSGTAKGRVGDREITFASLLPGAAPAIVRDTGEILIGLQVQSAFRDPSRDLAAVIELALEAEPGQILGLNGDPGEGPRLQDLLLDGITDVEVFDDFSYWLPEGTEVDGDLADALGHANEAITPTRKLDSVASAYWTDVTTKEYLRWVLPDEESAGLDALARLHAAGSDTLVEGSRLVGMFRAHGLLVPVWDLEVGTGADALEEPLAAYAASFAQVLTNTDPLTAAERGARAGLTSRQLTLRS